MLEIRYVLLLIVLIHYAKSQGAPNDSDQIACPQTYPLDWVVLFDSYRYEFLYDRLWLLRDFDGDNNGWVDFGGLCTRGLTTTPSGNENNWAFSQYIHYLNAREVIVNVSYTLQDVNNYFTAYRSDSNNSMISNTLRTDRSRYQGIVGGNVDNSRFVQTVDTTDLISNELRFSRPSNFNGFYLALQDQGVFIVPLGRILVYYRVVVARMEGLLRCPAIPLPPAGDTSTATCSCVDNSAPVSGVSLDVTCNNAGVCSGGQYCSCLPGYQLQSDQCTACPEGMFKHLHDNSTCLPCPTNSDSRGTNNSVCACIPPNIRDPNDPTAPCTTPPSSPRLILSKGGLPIVSGDVTTVCWLPALDKGGLDDLRYNVYIFNVDEASPTYQRLNPPEGVMQQVNDNNTQVCYDAETSGFEANYGILVVSTNGATVSTDGAVLDNVEVVQGRSVAFFVAGSPATVSASNSLAGPVAATFFVTAIVSAAIAALITALVMWLVCISRNRATASSNGTESKYSYKMESKYDDSPPSKPPPVLESDPASSRPAPSRPKPPQPPRPAPRQV